MRTCGIFTTHHMDINVTSNNNSINIIPFGDVHYGSERFANEVWEEFLEKSRKHTNNTYFLGMGDYIDFASSSERRSFKESSIHDSTEELLDTVAYKMTHEFFKQIKFMKKHMIGLLGGNHYWEFSDNNISSDARLAQLMDCTFLGCTSIIRLFLHYGDGETLTVDIFASHGKGSGKLPGSAYNTVEDMSRYCVADIFLMGHDHSRGVIPGRTRLEPRFSEDLGKLDIIERTPYLGRTGSFLKGYESGKRSYVVDGHYPPSSLGSIKLKIERVKSKKFGNHIKIHGIC
jgi:hypothetical protein